MRIDEIMTAFGAQFGLPDLAPDRDGAYHIDIDGMAVSVMEVVESGQTVIWARVGELPSEGQGAFCRMLLEAMAPSGEADGAVFSIQTDPNVIFLHRVEGLGAFDFDSFMSALSKFVDLLEKWRSRLADFRPEAENATEDESEFVRI